MVNYANGKIYKIVSDDTPNMCYIGSTTQTLCKRLGKHKSSYKSYLKGKGSYTSSFELLKTGNAIIYLIEDCHCASKSELLRREGELIRQYRFDPTREMVINKCIAGRTPKEYRQANKEQISLRDKQYYQDHKEQISVSSKQYYQDNKEKISVRDKQYYQENKKKIKEQATKPVTCPHCSRTIQHRELARHQKTKTCKSHQ